MSPYKTVFRNLLIYNVLYSVFSNTEVVRRIQHVISHFRDAITWGTQFIFSLSGAHRADADARQIYQHAIYSCMLYQESLMTSKMHVSTNLM